MAVTLILVYQPIIFVHQCYLISRKYCTENTKEKSYKIIELFLEVKDHKCFVRQNKIMSIFQLNLCQVVNNIISTKSTSFQQWKYSSFVAVNLSKLQKCTLPGSIKAHAHGGLLGLVYIPVSVFQHLACSRCSHQTTL